jgi:hypothetical protein
MCAQMLPPRSQSHARRSDHLPAEHRGEQPARWSRRLATINLVVAALTVLFWRGSLLALALGAIILAELLALIAMRVLTRHSRR